MAPKPPKRSLRRSSMYPNQPLFPLNRRASAYQTRLAAEIDRISSTLRPTFGNTAAGPETTRTRSAVNQASSSSFQSRPAVSENDIFTSSDLLDSDYESTLQPLQQGRNGRPSTSPPMVPAGHTHPRPNIGSHVPRTPPSTRRVPRDSLSFPVVPGADRQASLSRTTPPRRVNSISCPRPEAPTYAPTYHPLNQGVPDRTPTYERGALAVANRTPTPIRTPSNPTESGSTGSFSRSSRSTSSDFTSGRRPYVATAAVRYPDLTIQPNPNDDVFAPIPGGPPQTRISPFRIRRRPLPDRRFLSRLAPEDDAYSPSPDPGPPRRDFTDFPGRPVIYQGPTGGNETANSRPDLHVTFGASPPHYGQRERNSSLGAVIRGRIQRLYRRVMRRSGDTSPRF